MYIILHRKLAQPIQFYFLCCNILELWFISLILRVYGWFGWGLIISCLSKMGLMSSSSDQICDLQVPRARHKISASASRIGMKDANLFWRIINPSSSYFYKYPKKFRQVSALCLSIEFCVIFYSIFGSSLNAISIKTLNTRSSAFQCKADGE